MNGVNIMTEINVAGGRLGRLDAISEKAIGLKEVDVCGSKFAATFYDLIGLVQDLAAFVREDVVTRESAALASACAAALSDALAVVSVKEPIEALKDERDRYRAALTLIASGSGKQANRAQRALWGEDFR